MRNTGGYAFSLERASDCASVQSLASSAEIRQTPRPNQDAEVLAIEATGAFVAPQAVYDRVAKDLTNIRYSFAEVRYITAGRYTPNQVLVLFDQADGASAVLEGRYFDADCLNAIYSATRFRLIGTKAPLIVTVTFAGRFNIPLLAAEYAKLPGVKSAEPNGYVGTHPDVCLAIDGDTFFFIFMDVDPNGDCLAGCSRHIAGSFSTDSTGNITLSPSVSSQLGDSCTKWL
jgi:hypothetical protein